MDALDLMKWAEKHNVIVHLTPLRKGVTRVFVLTKNLTLPQSFDLDHKKAQPQRFDMIELQLIEALHELEKHL